MVKRDFSVWDFVKQEPKKRGFTILDGNSEHFTFTVDPSSEWVVDTTAGTNNIVLGSNMTISADVSDTVFISNLSVAGSAEIPPQEGQMRTIMDEDGYWSTQVYIPTQEWVTISRTDSMVTVDGNYPDLTPRVSLWTKFKNLFKKRA
jgi:hypothetical protein